MMEARLIVVVEALLLLWGAAGIASAQNGDIQRQTVVPNTAEHPRNGEGDIIQLKDGRLLLAWTRFLKGGSDFSPAEIAAMTSSDGGKTWSEPYVLQPNIGGTNVMEVSFLRLQNGEILLGYCVKDSEKSCRSTSAGRMMKPRPGASRSAPPTSRAISARTMTG